MCPIYMDTFTWQVVATFFAGACALVVGWRQVGIADRQAEIADGQKAIAEAQAATARSAVQIAEAQALTARLAQRGNLFDRRLKVHDVIRKYLLTALGGDQKKLFDLDVEVKEALNEATFLFPERINRLCLNALEIADECAQLTAERRIDNLAVSAERVRELRHQLRAILGDLSKVMGDEMNLFIEFPSKPLED